MDGSDRDRSASGRREPLQRAGGTGERGEAGAWLGSAGMELPEGCRERNGPRNRATPGETGEKSCKLFASLPRLQPLGPGRQPRKSEVEDLCPPLDYREGREAFTLGGRDGGKEVGKR